MIVDIYKINHKKWNYIILPQGNDIKNILTKDPDFKGVLINGVVVHTYRRIQSAHDTLSINSALNNDTYTQQLNSVGYAFAFKVIKYY